MDRQAWAKPETAKNSRLLVVVPIILGAAFVFWPFAVGINDTSSSGIIAKRAEARPETGKTQTDPVRPAYEPAAPRLLPHADTETSLQSAVPPRNRGQSAKEIIRHVAFPQVAQIVEINAADGSSVGGHFDGRSIPPRPLPRETVSSEPLPAQTVENQAADAVDSGPRYSWLLEGQAGVPVKTDRRSLELERIAGEADTHTRYGFSLANRGAYYSARAEFVKALRLLAQGLDAEYQTTVHGRALFAGLTALDEADDFISTGAQLESDLDFQAIINRHRTPVLKFSQPRTLTSLEALQRYFSFAQYQLGVAGGGEVAGSMALHALAKLYASSLDNPTANVLSAKPKAMTCFQAALVCYPGNYLAANDLGVLLAGSERYDDARKILEAAVENHPHSTIWRNLAAVYHQLGMDEQAGLAQHNQQLSLQRETANRTAALPGASDPRVCWLSPEEFAKTYGQTLDARQPLPARQAQAMARTEYPAKDAPQARPQKSKNANANPAVIESQSNTRWSWNVLDNMFK